LLEGGYTINAAQRGQQLQDKLRKMLANHPELANVRGLGLMTAVDVVKEDGFKNPDPTRRDAVIQAAFNQGLLLLGCGESAIRFCPPLCISPEYIDAGIRILSQALSATPVPAALSLA
jgi:4-aminobutyrate aminotransferase